MDNINHSSNAIGDNAVRNWMCAVVVAALILSVSAIGMLHEVPINDGVPGITDAEMNRIIESQYATMDEQYGAELMGELGMDYYAFSEAVQELMGSAIIITGSEDGTLSVDIMPATEAGKTDVNQSGKYLYVYLNSVATSALVGGGLSALSLGIGSAVITVIVGMIGSGGTTWIMEQMGIDKGVWFKIENMGEISVFGHKIYYPLPTALWSIRDFGVQ